jgi:hypothetical protein
LVKAEAGTIGRGSESGRDVPAGLDIAVKLSLSGLSILLVIVEIDKSDKFEAFTDAPVGSAGTHCDFCCGIATETSSSPIGMAS